jgi:hypothetical protein
MQIISAIAGLLMMSGFIPYIIGILRGKTKPAKASWIIWGLLDFIAMAGMYAAGSLNGQIVGSSAGVLIVVVLACMYGKPGWTTLDILCLTGAAFGLFLWWVTNDPVFGIVTSQIVVFVGAIPTFVSAWKEPEGEDRAAWMLFFISCVFACIAIPAWTLEDALQPINFTIIETAMIYIIWIRPRWLKKRRGAAINLTH